MRFKAYASSALASIDLTAGDVAMVLVTMSDIQSSIII
jgi:hypothetical protein